MNHPIPRRKGWDGRPAAPCIGPDPFELSRRLAEEEATKRHIVENKDASAFRAEEAAMESAWDAQPP